MSYSTEFKTSKAEIMGKSKDNYGRTVRDYPNEMPHKDNKELEEVAEIIRNHVQKIKGHKYFELDLKSISFTSNKIKAKAQITSLFSEESSEKIFHIKNGDVTRVEEGP